jgi:hypothetical protein
MVTSLRVLAIANIFLISLSLESDAFRASGCQFR